MSGGPLPISCGVVRRVGGRAFAAEVGEGADRRGAVFGLVADDEHDGPAKAGGDDAGRFVLGVAPVVFHGVVF